MDMKFLVYGTRSSKDKSGAYLFLPDGEAKVPEGWRAKALGPWEASPTEGAQAFLPGDPCLLGDLVFAATVESVVWATRNRGFRPA